MGVHGLWQLLQPTGQPVTLESLEGKVLAVDVSIWLHQTMKGMRDRDGNPLPNAHLQGLFSRICKLLFYRIKPVFVFDGGVPALKKQTLAARRSRRQEAERESEDISQKLLRNLMKSQALKQTLGDSSVARQRVPGVQKGRGQTDSDVFELPPLDESEEIRLRLNSEAWEKDFEQQKFWIKEGLASLADAHPDSEEFRSLPMEMQHEILNEFKEQKKYHSLSRLTQMPEDSTDFSTYQLKKLMKQSKLTSRIDEVRKQMANKTSGDISCDLQQDYPGELVEARRIVSEDAAHYVLIKGLTKTMQQEEANRFEVENKVKLEKIEADKTDNQDSQDKKTNSYHRDHRSRSSSSDSDFGWKEMKQTQLNRKKNQKVSSKRFIADATTKKGAGRKKTVECKADDEEEVKFMYEQNIKDNDNSNVIQILVDPCAVADDLFPASMFQTSSECENTDKLTEKTGDVDWLDESSRVPVLSVSFDAHRKHSRSATESDLSRLGTHPSNLQQDETSSRTESVNISQLTDRDMSSESQPAVASDMMVANKRMDILNEILSKVQEKKRQLSDLQVEFNTQEETCENDQFVVAETCQNGNNAIITTRLLSEESSIVTEKKTGSLIPLFESEQLVSVVPEKMREILHPAQLDRTSQTVPTTSSDYVSIHSDSEEDLQKAIQLSLQTNASSDRKPPETSINIESWKKTGGDGAGSLDQRDLTKESSDSESECDFITVEPGNSPQKGERVIGSGFVDSTVCLNDNEDSSSSTVVKSQDLENVSDGDSSSGSLDILKLGSDDLRAREPESDKKNGQEEAQRNSYGKMEASDVKEMPSDLEEMGSDLEEMDLGQKMSSGHKMSMSHMTDSDIGPSLPVPDFLQIEDYDHEDWDTGFLAQNNIQNAHSLLESERSALMSERGRQERLATSVTEQTNLEAQELLRLFGIPFIVSPVEAEAQCAYLDLTNQSQGTITDDSDIWLFGGRRVYKNFFNQSKHVEYFTYDKITTNFGLKREQLINLALLCGSDYTVGIEGVGPVRALEILAEFPGEGLEGLHTFRKWWSQAKKVPSAVGSKIRARLKDLEIIPGFPSQMVVDAYLNPEVDDSTDRFTWGTPELHLLREFAKYKFGWSREKTDQSLLPMMKEFHKKESQGRIHSYFQPQTFSQLSKIKSQRLKNALACLNNPDLGLPPDASARQFVPADDESDQTNDNSHLEGSVNLQDSGVPLKLSKKKEGNKLKNKDKKLKESDKNTGEVNINQETTLKKNLVRKVMERKKHEAVNVNQTDDSAISAVNSSLIKAQGDNVVQQERGNHLHRKILKRKMLMSLDQTKKSAGGKKPRRRPKEARSMNKLSDSSSSESEPTGQQPWLNEVKSPVRASKAFGCQSTQQQGDSCAPHAFSGQPDESKPPKSLDRKTCVPRSKTQKHAQDESSLPPQHTSTKVNTALVGAKKQYQEKLLAEHTRGLDSKAAGRNVESGGVTLGQTEAGDLRRVDVSIINKQYLPSTLSYLNQRSKSDRFLLHQLTGSNAVNAVEKRLEEHPRRQPQKGAMLATKQVGSFDDVFEQIDYVSTQKLSKKTQGDVRLKDQGKGSGDKRPSLKQTPPAQINLARTDFSDSSKSPDTHNVSVSSGGVCSKAAFKSLRSAAFDKPINEMLDGSFSKENKFKKQTEHLADIKSVRGLGALPRQIVVGKGKGRGKNRNQSSTEFGKSKKNTTKMQTAPEQEYLEYASITAEDLGSDFSEGEGY